MRSAFMNSMQSKPLAEATKGLGGGAGGGEWEAGMSDESDEDDEGGGGGGPPSAAAQQSQVLVVEEDEPEEIVYDPDARSVTLTLTGAMVSLDIEIQVKKK